MLILQPIALFGFIPLVLALFWLWPARRALIAAFLIGWLFLPENIGFKVGMLPVYSKVTATTVVPLLGMLLFDWKRVLGFRPRWIDLPFVAWCAARFGAAISNGTGWYDGLNFAEYTVLVWGLPWFYGRLYFSDWEGMRELATGIALGGVIYAPLCLFESRMSPSLHLWVYGVGQMNLEASVRFGGWRPMVFMQHGLMLGLWMGMSGLTCFWLWLTGAVQRIGWLRMSAAACIVVGTAIICRSLGAIALTLGGMGLLWAAWKMRRAWPLWIVVLFVPAYMTLRFSGGWSGGVLLDVAGLAGDSDRVVSLQCRLNSEDQFIRAGMHQPLLGFRNWGNTIQYQSNEQAYGIADALWMIEFTNSGLIGLSCLVFYLLGPTALMLRQMKRGQWSNAAVLPAVGLGMVVTLWACDCLFNGMLSPVYMLASGALSGWRALPAAAPRQVVLPRVRAWGLESPEGMRPLGL